jgi:hypothetical protein
MGLYRRSAAYLCDEDDLAAIAAAGRGHVTFDLAE